MSDWGVAPILGVLDVVLAVDFFCDKLGFSRPVRLYGGPGEPPVYGIVSREGISVHLQIRDPAARPVARGVHDCDGIFTVPAVDSLATEFAARGVKFVRQVQDEPYGMRDFTIETPDGLRLVFAMPL
jgi:catechol 2,3-dioxygenase-like lactoylglutathione lyase family enzyme